MLAYDKERSRGQGSKTARMEQRLTPEAKDTIERAAGMLGVNPSEFTVLAATEAARSVLRQYETTMLKPEAHAAFRAALDDVAPSRELVDLMALHAEVTGR